MEEGIDADNYDDTDDPTEEPGDEAERGLIPGKHWITLNGKRYILQAGLLYLAHQKGLCSVKPEMIQIPAETNNWTAIVRVTTIFSDGKGGEISFGGLGDASPETMSQRENRAYVRMAETRAFCRALRVALNVGETAFEEMGSAPGNASGSYSGRYADEEPHDRRGARRMNGGTQADLFCMRDGCGEKITAAQATVSKQKFNAQLCPRCQSEAARAQRSSRR